MNTQKLKEYLKMAEKHLIEKETPQYKSYAKDLDKAQSPDLIEPDMFDDISAQSSDETMDLIDNEILSLGDAARNNYLAETDNSLGVVAMRDSPTLTPRRR